MGGFCFHLLNASLKASCVKLLLTMIEAPCIGHGQRKCVRKSMNVPKTLQIPRARQRVSGISFSVMIGAPLVVYRGNDSRK